MSLSYIDSNGREKFAKSIKVINHPIRDAINNTTFDEKFVEITVIGRVRGEWKEYMPLNEFIKLNPELSERLKRYGEL